MSSSCVLVGISGGIAAYKTAQLVSDLKKEDLDIQVIMTAHAQEFITPLTLETLSHNRVCCDSFDRNFPYQVNHIALAKKADCFVLVPATANIIAKVVHGIADDLVTTTFLACDCPKILCPAMNTGMLTNPVTMENLQKARQLGYQVIDCEEGHLACGDQGKGRLANLTQIEEAVLASVSEKPLAGCSVLVTAGPTQESLDPVRFFSNHSSGKMGYALARQANYMGARVTLIHGPCSLQVPYGVQEVTVLTAQQMLDAVSALYSQQDILIMAAAVADYTPVHYSEQKIKKTEASWQLPLQRTPDILEWLGEHKRPGQILCGFAMETQDLIANATEKRVAKNADMIAANSINEPGCGFQTDTNQLTLISEQGVETLPFSSKDQQARECLLRLNERRIRHVNGC